MSQSALGGAVVTLAIVAGIVSLGASFFRRGDLFLVTASINESAVTPHDGTATVLRTTV